MRRLLLTAFALALSQPACVVAGGYSSGRGFYIWPGSFLSILVVLVVLFLLRRRRQ